MDPALTAPEAARVLRTGGALTLAWNEPDMDIPWVAELVRLTSDENPLVTSEAEHDSPPAPFRKYDTNSFAWVQPLAGPEELVDLAGTWSWVALHPRRQTILDAVGKLGASIQARDGAVRVPHRCHCIRYTL